MTTDFRSTGNGATFIAAIAMVLMTLSVVVFAKIGETARTGHFGFLMFSLGVLLGRLLPRLFRSQRLAMYGVLALVHEGLIVVGAVTIILFPLERAGRWRMSLALYLGKFHPFVTAAMIFGIGIIAWLVKKRTPFGYGCVEILFAIVSAYYTAQHADPGNPWNIAILGAGVYLVVRGIDNAVNAGMKKAETFLNSSRSGTLMDKQQKDHP